MIAFPAPLPGSRCGGTADISKYLAWLKSGVSLPADAILQEAKDIGDEFLALEKYVNLNYLVSTACVSLALSQKLASTLSGCLLRGWPACLCSTS